MESSTAATGWPHTDYSLLSGSSYSTNSSSNFTPQDNKYHLSSSSGADQKYLNSLMLEQQQSRAESTTGSLESKYLSQIESKYIQQQQQQQQQPSGDKQQ